MPAQQVIQTFTQAAELSQTVAIYFYGMIGSDYRSGFAWFGQGQLLQFFVYDASGAKAIELLEMMEVRGVTVVPQTVQSRSKDAGLPALSEILRVLEENILEQSRLVMR
jgi:hypothetical protein